ncbi:MAG: ABC transporter ATP-binding protein, partial [Raoultibacter sp.]
MDIVAVDNLVKRYKEVVALDHFSLHIEPGEIFGLLGPNGSGKTTAINCMLQLLTYDKGSIELFGEPMRPTRYDLKRRIGIVPQNVAVFEELTVRENIDYFCALYIHDKTLRRKLVDEAIEFVGLQEFTKFRPRKLSGGLVRRLNIACGIAHKPELIFFDEPTVAVDPQSRNAILTGIQKMNAQGSTIIYTSHYMEEVEEICSRIMIMDRGCALATGTNNELKAMINRGEKIQIDVEDMPEGLLRILEALPHIMRATYRDSLLEITCENSTHNLGDILTLLQR